jgi:archaellin
VTERLEPVTKTGSVADDGSGGLILESIDVVLQQSPGAGDINVSAATLEIEGPSGVTRISLANAGSNGASFAKLQDDDSSLSSGSYILNDPKDQVVLTLDLDSSSMTGANGGTTYEFRPGDEATLNLNTESGATSIIRVTVPQSLSGEDSVTV